eukprot:6192176-Pleurochrysis_carterae.AAC.1
MTQGSELAHGGDQALGDGPGQTSCTPSMRLGLDTRLRSIETPRRTPSTVANAHARWLRQRASRRAQCSPLPPSLLSQTSIGGRADGGGRTGGGG